MQRTDKNPRFETTSPKVLYFGNPVALIRSLNEDDTPNLAPISTFWALGMTIGLLKDTKTSAITLGLEKNWGAHSAPKCS